MTQQRKKAWNAVTEERVIDRCNELGFTYINHYIEDTRKGRATVVEFICSKHKDKGIQKKTWGDMKRYSKVCPYCSGRYKTTDEFKAEIYAINNNIEITGEYIGHDYPISCKCKICTHEWSPRAGSLKVSGCPECANRNKKYYKLYSNDEFNYLLNQAQPNLVLLGDYNGTHNTVKLKCLTHDCEFSSYPSNILNNSSHCPECTKEKQTKRTQNLHDYFIERVNKQRQDIDILGIYNGMHKKIKCMCKIHNYKYDATPNVLLDNHITCPICQAEKKLSSKGERRIVNFFLLHNINFDPQHKFEDCIYLTRLRFDFYLPDYNICIEYDGEQHFKPVAFNNMPIEEAEENLRITKIRDNIKNNYCDEHNIPLIRIPYWEYDNIDNILYDKLNLDPQRLSSHV